jgi:catechol 2,3-dioxygenase
MTRTFLPDETAISQVRLRTANLARLREFYTRVLGLAVVSESRSEAGLSAGENSPPMLFLGEEPDATPRADRTTGLYHFAIRYPDRAALARAFSKLVEARYPVEGASDHDVSEAIYLSDPDHNGVELYADRPRGQWRWQSGQVAMTTKPLDLNGLLAAAHTGPATNGSRAPADIGHIHLHVASLDVAERFYHEYIGLAVTQRNYPGALFFAAGGYHHHVGVNTWAGPARPAPKSVGLVSCRFAVPVREILYCLAHRAPLLGFQVLEGPPTQGWELLRVRDPDGNIVEFES